MLSRNHIERIQGEFVDTVVGRLGSSFDVMGSEATIKKIRRVAAKVPAISHTLAEF